MIDWILERFQESNGFVCKRIHNKLHFYFLTVYGSFFYKFHGQKIYEIIHPEKIYHGYEVDNLWMDECITESILIRLWILMNLSMNLNMNLNMRLKVDVNMNLNINLTVALNRKNCIRM